LKNGGARKSLEKSRSIEKEVQEVDQGAIDTIEKKGKNAKAPNHPKIKVGELQQLYISAK
jgi:hypothetical protein